MTTFDPNVPEDDLPPKPPIEDMPPEQGIEPPEEDVDVPDEDFLAPEEAAQDDTVDDEEDDRAE